MTKAKKTPTKATKRQASKKSSGKAKRKIARTKEPHVYIAPKMAAEVGIVCLGITNAAACGKAVVWFDYELGEKDHMSGFVCDDHRVSDRVEKLAMPENLS